MSSQIHDFIEIGEAMPQLSHLDQIRKTDAVICRAQELGDVRRTSVTLCRKFLEECRPDVYASQHPLFAGCRRFQAPFRQFLCKGWGGSKCEWCGTYAISNDAVDHERASITTHNEFYGARDVGKSRRKSLDAIHPTQVDSRSVRIVALPDMQMHKAGPIRRPDFPCSRNVWIRNRHGLLHGF